MENLSTINVQTNMKVQVQILPPERVKHNIEFDVRDSRVDDFMLELLKIKRDFQEHPQFKESTPHHL